MRSPRLVRRHRRRSTNNFSTGPISSSPFSVAGSARRRTITRRALLRNSVAGKAGPPCSFSDRPPLDSAPDGLEQLTKLEAFKRDFKGFARKYKDRDNLAGKVREQLDGWSKQLDEEGIPLVARRAPWTFDDLVGFLGQQDKPLNLLFFNVELASFRSPEVFAETMVFRQGAPLHQACSVSVAGVQGRPAATVLAGPCERRSGNAAAGVSRLPAKGRIDGGFRADLGQLRSGVHWLQCVPLKGGGIIIRSVRSGTTCKRRETICNQKGSASEQRQSVTLALTGAASASVKIILDALRAWRTTGHSAHNQTQASAFEITDAVIEDASDWGDGPSRSFG